MTTIYKSDLCELQAAVNVACTLLKALSNQDRLRLLCQMTQGEFSVGELQATTGVRQPTLSQQLAVLRDEGILDTRRDGRQIFYSIASEHALAALNFLHALYCGNVRRDV